MKSTKEYKAEIKAYAFALAACSFDPELVTFMKREIKKHVSFYDRSVDIEQYMRTLEYEYSLYVFEKR
jgi:hypothetical protein